MLLQMEKVIRTLTPIVFKAKCQSSYKGHLLHEALLTVLLPTPQVEAGLAIFLAPSCQVLWDKMNYNHFFSLL